MKIVDDYRAKYRLWAAAPRVVPPGAAGADSRFPLGEVQLVAGIQRVEGRAIRRLAEEAARRERPS